MDNENETTPPASDNVIRLEGSAMTDPDVSAAVEAVENFTGDYSNEFMLCVLLTVTVNAIHVIEDKAIRKRIEEEYIKALRFLSAVQEQLQPEDTSDPRDWADECMTKMIRHVSHAIGSWFQIPE